MFVPRKNGFVNIIASLYALAETTDVDSWTRSVCDVCWVVSEVLAAWRNARYAISVIAANVIDVSITSDLNVPAQEPRKQKAEVAVVLGPPSKKYRARR